LSGKAAADARSVALRVLAGVEAGGRSDRLLDRELRRANLDPRDRGLATEIVYGVLRHQAALDDAIRPHCERPLRQLDPRVLGGLRLGVYQAAYLDSVPPHAAVDATVGAVRRSGSRGHGLVNAVLRSWLRTGGEMTPAHDDAGRWQVPQWLAQRWVRRYGRERAGAWLVATLAPPVNAVAVHSSRGSTAEAAEVMAAAGIRVEPSPWGPRMLRVLEGGSRAADVIASGRVTPRSEASRIVTSLLGPGEGPVLDACAGRGGKSLQLLEDGVGGPVVALDNHLGRLRDAEDAARRIGVDGLRPVAADASRPLPLRSRFDRILVDAPCSGLGTMRRHPEIRWRVRPRRLERLAQVQRAILTQSLAVLRRGGQLLYVTCSTEPEENEQVVEAVLAGDRSFRAVPLEAEGAATGLVGADGYFRTYPDEPDLDGFFAALLTRR
jgi:16S rRNA (cytosine967-C5)-methyltransferase